MIPGTMSFREQLRAVRRAKVLVGFHGAGLAHLLFLNDQASVVELSLPVLASRTNLVTIARNVGITYMIHLLEPSARRGKDGADAVEAVYVPPPELLGLLEVHLP
jgi:capsular polysaccharide biosynthesis protein